MNATSLYVFTCRLSVLADAEDKSTWGDLYRLLPYLRQSISCSVCGEILKDPHTPVSTGCQHHTCKDCRGGRKRLKPACVMCKDIESYPENFADNPQLRCLVQCYQKMCEFLIDSDIYKKLQEEECNGSSGGLVELIQEAVNFEDDYQPEFLDKMDYSILPCIFNPPKEPQYSVMYGSGNKITIKRKPVEEEPIGSLEYEHISTSFKKPNPNGNGKARSGSKRKGCRCGNATATPGKLTCCGQRCPCYVESKACIECKCKGCRNPHRADGLKIRPHITVADVDGNLVTLNSEDSGGSPSGSNIETLHSTLDVQMNDGITFPAQMEPTIYSNQLHEVSASLPDSIMMDEEDQLSDASPTHDDADADGWAQCSPQPCSSSSDSRISDFDIDE